MLFPELAMDSCKGIVHSLESFGSVDGPGVRFVVFMQGCEMRCKYCHNPETWSHDGEIYTPDMLFKQAWKYRHYWGKNMENGGVTVSGGEPLLQIEFVTEFFKLLKKHGIHTAIDTSGQPFSEDEKFLDKFNELLNYTDLVILDIKHIDKNEHKKLTGHDNAPVLSMARYLSDKEKPLWIRHVLVPGITDSDKQLYGLKSFIDTLKSVKKAEVLPYHTLGVFKWKKLGIPYPLENVSIPTEMSLQNAKKIISGL